MLRWRGVSRSLHRRLASSFMSTLGCFPGTEMPFAPHVVVRTPQTSDIIPCFRLLDEDGSLVDGAADPELGKDVCTAIYQGMVRLNTMDNVLYDAQRQGRLSFYMTSYGEEATQFGTASALRSVDMVFAQYREPGVLMWRGFTLQEFIDQCCGNEDGHAKGRQMPIHYGSEPLNYPTVSSPLATQTPHAVGAAYAFKLAKEDRISVCYFGDGASSEGDFHAALNLASTRECPVLFICRNNGFAISTPTKEQYRGDGIASRGAGYGIPAMRVDGNDFLAVHEATRVAREHIQKHNEPVLLEAMSYRQSHHSTSDDSTQYRPLESIMMWKEKYDPIDRTKRYLLRRGWLTEEEDKSMRERARSETITALQNAETKRKPSLDTLFEDVYDKKTTNLREQEQEMREHIAKYPDRYPFR